jgi:monofunctional biosynthetic peptidoglycan transglycosylase
MVDSRLDIPQARPMRRRGSRALAWLALMLGLLAALPLAAGVAYRWVPPPASMLMAIRWAQGSSIDYRWTPLEQISPHLQRAVLAGEDSNFFKHDGFDWNAIQKAWDEAVREGEAEAREECEAEAKAARQPIKQCADREDEWIPPLPKFGRGASTVTQQLAKNLYLSEERNFLRKGREALYTYFLERDLSKKRILELYLNVIEWGDGVYGAEAASRFYFNKSASGLTREEAAYLAAMIPSPLNVFNPQKNPKRVKRRQRVLLKYMNGMRLDYSVK